MDVHCFGLQSEEKELWAKVFVLIEAVIFVKLEEGPNPYAK